MHHTWIFITLLKQTGCVSMKDMFKQINPVFFFIKIYSGSSSSLTLHPGYAWFGPCKDSEPIWITACHISRLSTHCCTGFVERLTGGQSLVLGSLLLPSELYGWSPGERMVETCQQLKSSLQCELLFSSHHKGVQSRQALRTVLCFGSDSTLLWKYLFSV